MPPSGQPPPRAGFVVQTLDDLFLLVAFEASHPAALAWLGAEVERFASERPGRAIYLHVILPPRDNRLQHVDERTRAAMVDFMRKAEPLFSCAALVLGLTGFYGAAMRSLFSTLLFAARVRLPLRVSSDLAEATAFLGARASAGARMPSVTELSAAVDALSRAAIR